MEASRIDPSADTQVGAAGLPGHTDTGHTDTGHFDTGHTGTGDSGKGAGLVGRKRRRWRRGVKAAIALVLAATAVALVARPSLVESASGSGGAPQLTTFGGGRAPAFSLPDLTYPTRTLSLSQFRGRPVLVNFWASWCVPCRKEMPLLEAAYRRVHGRVAFLGVDTNDTSGAALSFLRQTGVTYPSAYDPHGTAATAYGLFGLPTTVFVAPDGKMLERHVGALSSDALTTGIARLMRTASKPTAHH